MLACGLAGPCEGHRWAVLANDPAGPAMVARDRVQVYEVGGCACCTGALIFRTTLVRALRAGPWQRFLVDASPAANLAALIDVLRDPSLAGRVAVEAVIVAVDGRHARAWLDPADPLHTLAIGQRDCADIIVLTAPAPDAATDEALERVLREAPFGAPAILREYVASPDAERRPAFEGEVRAAIARSGGHARRGTVVVGRHRPFVGHGCG